MEKKIISDPRWSPTKRLWFGKFQYAITLGPFQPLNCVEIGPPYKCRTSWAFDDKIKKDYEVKTVAYIDSLEMLKGLMNTYPFIKVQTPMNKHHEKILKHSKDTRTLIRDKLWHNKYKFRVSVQPKGRRFTLTPDKGKEQEFMKARTTIIDMFKGTSYLRHTRWYNWSDMPFIYTSDEKSLMLLKLSYSNDLDISVTEAVTFDEIRQMA